MFSASRFGQMATLALVIGAAMPSSAVRAPMLEREVPDRGVGAANAGGRAGGLRPWTMGMSHLGASYRLRRPVAKKRALKASPIPSAWDSRNHGWVTPIRNQGSYGTCWAHAALASIETSLLKAGRGEYDLSENHMAAHNVGFLWGYNDGGNNQIATALLASWRDPILEAQDPYGHPDSNVTLPPAFHVQRVIWFPERRGEDNDEPLTSDGVTFTQTVAANDVLLKQAVIDYGAVGVCYFHSASCYDGTRGSHYMESYDTFAYKKDTDGGHAVTMIGWDDNYPRTNFRKTDFQDVPPGDGAFLCKNSWGGSSGTNGCLWISYYDDCFCYMPPAAYPAPDETNVYGRVYQHDPCGQVVTWNVYLDADDEKRGGKENWGANMFTAAATGIVEAVGFYAGAAGTEYTLRVYNDCANSPASGTLVSSQSGVTDCAGFVTVSLATPMPITACSERFAVVMRLETPDYDYPLPVASTHYIGSELFCTNVAHAGESFLSSNGVDWVDFQDYPGAGRTENLCIKAYTRHGTDGEAANIFTSATPATDRVSAKSEDPVTFSVQAAGTGVTFEWRLDGMTQAATGNAFVYVPAPGDHGTHLVACRASRAGVAELHSWTVAVTGVVHVDASSVATDPDGTAGRPFPTITAALGTVLPGDEIVVAEGTYAGCVTPYAQVLIRSESGPAKTFIDGNDAARCYYGGYAPEAILSGFTLVNGNSKYGGGAYGGTLSNCVITACIANYGGGAYNCTLSHCTVVGNVAYQYYGGGVDYKCTVADSIVWGNYYCDANGNYSTENWYSGRSNTFRYTCTTPKPTGAGNIKTDPLFLDADNGDFRLRTGSPCLGTASDGGNMGAWQGDGLTPCTIAVDIVGGGRVCPESATVAPGESATFTASTDHPLLGFATNGVPVVMDGYSFVWENINADGTLSVVFDDVDFHVDAATGDDANDGWTAATAKRTLQAAADAANDGEQVIVSPGVYAGVEPARMGLTIKSIGGPGVTFIDGGGVSRCFEDYGTATLDGFTLVNGAAADDDGGGAFYGTLVGCVISNCTAKQGGGVAEATLTNCLVTSCRATRNGGGVYESLLVNCTVAGNSAGWFGGGAYLQKRGGAVNTVTAENSSDRGYEYGNDVYGNLYWSMVASLSDVDAKFVDSAHGDFRLKVDSPAVDAGDNAGALASADLAGNPRVVGARVDMGAFERQLDFTGGWTDPQVAVGDAVDVEGTKVSAAMTAAGFPSATAAAVTRLADYSALIEWANAHGVDKAQMTAAKAPLASAALGAEGLLELTGEDVRIASLASVDGGLKLCLNLPHYNAVKVNASLLKAAIGVKGAESLGGAMTSDGLSVAVTPGDGNVEVDVAPPELSPSYFLRTTIR